MEQEEKEMSYACILKSPTDTLDATNYQEFGVYCFKVDLEEGKAGHESQEGCREILLVQSNMRKRMP